jgi:NADH-quinone oxidoreductase subunit G
MTADIVTLTINNREVTVPKGTLLVEAAKVAGIEIPVFCYHPKLKPVGACRMCLVEIEKMPALQTACTTPVADGMIVRSNAPAAVAAQNGVLELMLANHPLDCPICDKGGECPLQDNTFRYGLGVSRMTEERRKLDKALPLSDRIVLDRERCIMCFRCVRFQSEIPGDEALAVLDRGSHSEIGLLPGETFDSPFSGNTIEICPVGALTSRQYRFRARPWDLKRTPSVCAGCPVGCNIELHARDGRILRMVARDNPQVDDGWLCDHGRFETLPPLESGRPTRPLIRHDGSLQTATWDEALAHAAEVLASGPSGVLASPSLTNEAIWALDGPLRSALPHAELACSPEVSLDFPLTGAIANLPACTRIVVAGLDPWTELPVLALWIRKAVVRGATLVVVGPANGLYRDSAAWLRVSDADVTDTLSALLVALEGGGSEPLLRQAADRLASGAGPAAVLSGPGLAADPGARQLLERLATKLDANAATGLIGAPVLSANGRGVQLLAPRLAVDPARLTGRSAQLLIGAGPWSNPEGTKLVLATNAEFKESPEIEVVLPLAHPYEQGGSLTNLEGRIQRIEASGFAAPGVQPDWAIIARLANTLTGGVVPIDLLGIRAALAADHPAYAKALSGGLPARGRLLEGVGVA